MSNKFEYMVIPVYENFCLEKVLESMLNRQATEGWEMVQMLNKQAVTYTTFKRPIIEK